MNKDNINQIEEFSQLWHEIIKKSNFRKIEEQFPRLNGLTTIEISIISIVSKSPDAILGEIISFLDIPKSTLTSAVDRLEKRKYINRTISKRDRDLTVLNLQKKAILLKRSILSLNAWLMESY